MAYGEKYFYTYCDYEDVLQKISILEKDYEGENFEVRAAPIPFSVTYESTSDYKFDPIRPSKANINLLYDEGFDFAEFWTADERQYKVEKYYNWNPDTSTGELKWVGYVIPEGFSYLMQNRIKYAHIEAADGLSTLKSILFLDTNGKPYGVRQPKLTYTLENGQIMPYSLIFTEILRKLELDIDTWIAFDVYERSMNKFGVGREFDPASQAYKNVRTYINDSTRDDIPYWQEKGQVWDCDRVMRALLTVWGAKIYQQDGVWKIKRVNVDANRVGRYWHQYNTLGVYIGRQQVTGSVNIPCRSVTEVLVGRDHVISMDRVFQSVRVNYRYSFEKDAGQAQNRVENGDFAQWGAFTPEGWQTYNMNVEETALTGVNTDGITTAMRLTNETAQRSRGWVWNDGNEVTVNEGEELFIEYWEQIAGGSEKLNWNGLTAFLLIGDNGHVYCLVNDGIQGTVDSEGNQTKGHKGAWIRLENFTIDRVFSPRLGLDALNTVYFGSYPELLFEDRQDYIDNDFWAKVVIRSDGAPVSGSLSIFIRGAARRGAYYFGQVFARTPYPVYYPFASDDNNLPEWRRSEVYTNVPNNRRRQYYITGLQIGSIVDPSNEPNDQTYIINNEGVKYTDRFEPVTVYNGDAGDEDHISNILVPSDGSDRLKWDNYDGDYGNSAIGLILAKSILNQYNKPNRMIDGAIAARGLEFGTVVTFSSLPSLQFIVQRGTFSDYDIESNFAGTLVQIAQNEAISGGFDNGNTLDPIYAQTGKVRCVKDESNLNTGVLEEELTDINSASETYGESIWEVVGEDLTYCPIGEPTLYYWGSSGPVLDLNDLVTTPWGANEAGVTFQFTNIDGNYLYLLHLDDGTLIEQVYNAYQGNIVSDWQYLSDIEIDGFTYRQFRIDFITGAYENYPLTFVWNA